MLLALWGRYGWILGVEEGEGMARGSGMHRSIDGEPLTGMAYCRFMLIYLGV